jgi:hypothetical protein
MMLKSDLNKTFKVHSFLKQCCARSSVDSKQGTSADVSLIGLVKIPCLESTENRANTILKRNELFAGSNVSSGYQSFTRHDRRKLPFNHPEILPTLLVCQE